MKPIYRINSILAVVNITLTVVIIVVCLVFQSCGSSNGGSNGRDGVNGMNGVNGAIGNTGDAGTQGIQGIIGPTGNAGLNGITGPTGANGQNAVLSSGIVGSRVNSQFSACHHDYMYLSNGWLLFRHQANGTADQGAGTTGFNVWNVDINDFLLISEVGSVTYCTLHFDKTNATLSYTVNYSNDGKLNEQGVINL